MLLGRSRPDDPTPIANYVIPAPRRASTASDGPGPVGDIELG
jgi:hypothetical protein